MMECYDKDKECGKWKGRYGSKGRKWRGMRDECCDRGDRREGSCEKKDDCCDKKKGKCGKMFLEMMLMKHISIAVEVMWGDLTPIQKDVICAIVAKKLRKLKDKGKSKRGRKEGWKGKGKCKGKEEDCKLEGEKQCRGKSKDKWEFKSKIKCIVKKLMEHKEELLKNIDIAFNAFKEVSERESPHPIPPHKFAKQIGKIVKKLRKKKHGTEKPEDYAKNFWIKKIHKTFKKLRKKAKKIAKTVVFYSCDTCDDTARKALAKSLADMMAELMIIKMMKKGKMMKGECKEGKEGKEAHGPPHHGPPGFGHHFGHGMPFGHGMKMMFKMKMMGMMAKIATKLIEPSKEILKACIEPANAAIEEYMKTHKVCCPEKFKKKTLGKILKMMIKLSLGEKKGDDFYKDAIKRVLEGKITPCSKKCFKACKKLAKCVFIVEGVHDKSKRELATNLGTIRCCQTNAKDGCTKEVCLEFLKKWAKDGVNMIEEAKKVEEEVRKECQDGKCKELGIPAVIICKMMRKSVKQFLEMYTTENKFDAEDCKKKLKENCEAYVAFIEKCKSMCGKKCKGKKE